VTVRDDLHFSVHFLTGTTEFNRIISQVESISDFHLKGQDSPRRQADLGVLPEFSAYPHLDSGLKERRNDKHD